MYSEKGGTIAWMIDKEGIAVIDAQYPPQAARLIGLLKKQSDAPFECLVNTHHHGDHTSGNISFKGIVNNVVAHANSLVNQKIVATSKKTEDKQLYPEIVFTDKWRTKIGDERITAHYFGCGHTNGDVMIHFEHANIVHCGDLVFNRIYPYIDRSAGASIKGWALALEIAQKKFDKDTQFIFGHAYDPQKVVGTMDDLAAMQNFMERLDSYVIDSLKAGKTRDEILNTIAIPGVTDWQGEGIIRGLAAAYDEQTT